MNIRKDISRTNRTSQVNQKNTWHWNHHPDFEKENEIALHHFTKGFMPWGTLACSGYTVLDFLVAPPDVLAQVLFLRALTIGVLLFISVYVWMAPPGKLVTFLSAFGPLFSCASVTLMAMEWNPGANIYGAGIAVPAMSLSFLTMKPIYTLGGAVFISSCYLGITWFFGNIPPESYISFVSNGFILIGVVLLNVVLSARAHKLRWIAWCKSVELEKEKTISENLLQNMLPQIIAERLKDGEGVIADAHMEVSVVFSDIVGFTKLSSMMSPEDLEERLNEIFSEFDTECSKLRLEKIKTIGDAYMVVAGAPYPRKDHAEACVHMALAMQKVLKLQREKYGDDLDVRIGVHSGKIVAGVIGMSKFAYDIWGDTVNIASRMESHCIPGRIQISDATKALIQDSFFLEPRGELEVKGKGIMKTWFVISAK